MKRASVLLLALTLPLANGCGGRVQPIDGLEDLDGAIDDDASTGVDTGVVGFDTGSRFDTGVIGTDGGRPDTSVIGPDSGPRPDTGVIGTDGGRPDTIVRDTGVLRDTGVIGSDGGVVGPTVAECEKIAKASCTSATKTCCESRGFVYDAFGCEDANNNWCDDGRDGVAAGKTTYDPSFLTACIDAWTKLTTTCSVPILDYVRDYVPCSQMLNGKTAAGGVCARATECYAPPGYAAFCDDSGSIKRCRAYAIVGAGASCNYYGGTIRYCSAGLFCDYGGGPTVCRPVTPIGGACFGADDTSCGIGNSCKAGRCAVGTPAFGSCVRDLECASWSCTGSRCTDPNALIASTLFCSGT